METSGLQTHMHRTNQGHPQRYRSAGCISLFLWAAINIGSLVNAQTGSVQRVEIPSDQSGFQPKAAHDVTISFKGVAATFKASSPMVLILDSPGVRRSVTLPSEFVQMGSARLFTSDRLVVTGMVNGDVSEVIIVDSNKAEMHDHFLCYSPTVSPDGRYVAFVKFYPAHGVNSVEDHYSIYDAKLSPEQNRPPLYPHNPAVVGKIVYPNGLSNKPSDNVDLESTSTHRMVSDGFFWDEQSVSVVFADEFHDELSAVVVGINNGVFSTDSLLIPKQWICPDVTPCFEHLARVDFNRSLPSSVDLRFRGVNGTPAKESHVIISHDNSGRLRALRSLDQKK